MSFFSRKAIIVTHDGAFHPDDVFAVACVLLVDQKAEVIRTREVEKIKKAEYVIDVGGVYNEERNFFDHHQIGGAGERPNGIPFASFGLVWKKYGLTICGKKEIAEMVDQKLVQFLDLVDNGVGEFLPIFKDVQVFSVADMITNMNPNIKNRRDTDHAFYDAVSIAKKILLDEIRILNLELEAEKALARAYEEAPDKRFLILNQSYSWFNLVPKYKEVIFVIEPDFVSDNDSNWKVKAVRDNPNNFVNRKDLPLEWAGKRGDELSRITGVSDAIFCHSKRFMAVAKSKEGAKNLALIALKN